MSFGSRRRGEECLSDLSFDMLIAGDLSPELSLRARRHAGVCEPCHARWTELSRQAESRSLPALRSERAGLPREPRGPSRTPRRRRSMPAGMRWAGVAAAAACAFLLFQRFALREVMPGGERLKGGGRLGFFVQRAGEVSRGGPGELLHPGDALQLTYFAPSAGYLVVLSRDASGRVEVYYPSARAAAPVVAGEQALSTSTLLDDTLGEETIEAVFCTTQRDVEVLRAARQGGTLALDGCRVDELRVVKEAP
jgi:hypothetical protein